MTAWYPRLPSPPNVADRLALGEGRAVTCNDVRDGRGADHEIAHPDALSTTAGRSLRGTIAAPPVVADRVSSCLAWCTVAAPRRHIARSGDPHMTHTRTHTVGTAGRLAILSREELERLDAAALEVLAGRRRVDPVREGARRARRPGGGGRRRARHPAARARAASGRPGAGADDPRRQGRRAARHRRACRSSPPTAAASRSTTSRQRREARHHGRGRGDHLRAWSTRMPEVDFCWPAVSAQDRPAEVRGLHELYLAIANTGKHVQTVTVVEPELAEVAVAMARAVAGSRRAAARRAAHQRAARHGHSARQRRRARWRPAWSSRRPASPSAS